MAISTQRTLAQLKKECSDLGIEVSFAGTKEGKTDYILALRDYWIGVEYPEGLPKSLEYMISMESPMLAIQSKSLPKEELDQIFESKYYIAQEKIDGFRYVNFLNFDGASSYAAYSRNISVKDYMPVEYGHNLLLDDVDFTGFGHKVIIDSELVSTNPNISTELNGRGVVCETGLQSVVATMGMNHDDSVEIQRRFDHPFVIKAFDIIYLDGKDLKDEPYIERHKILVKIVEELRATGLRIEIPATSYKNKKAFAKAIISNGGEGAILKDIRSKYKASSNRDKYAWLKVKRGFWNDGLDDTIDAWVTGYEMSDENKQNAGLVGSLTFSTNVQCMDGHSEVREIGRISNIDLEMRKKITVLDENGNPSLDPDWYGRIAEIQGQCISARARRLKHCILVQWREDKSIDGCSITEEWIENNIL